MGVYEHVVYQDELVSYLRQVLRHKNISHAYMLESEQSSVLKELALGFAMSLLCSNAEEEACLNCHSCKQFEARNNPDFIHVIETKAGIISVSDIRAQILDSIRIKPYASKKKVYVIENAQHMTREAQNALLKILEEAPPYAVIMLLCDSRESFLETIRSRCLKLRLKPLARERLAYILISGGMDESIANDLAAYVDGNMSRAIDFLKDKALFDSYNKNLAILSSIAESKMADIFDYVKDIRAGAMEDLEFISMARLWYRDVLLLKLSDFRDKLIFASRYKNLKNQTQLYVYEDFAGIFSALDLAEDRYRANVNKDLTIQLLLKDFMADGF